MASRWTTKRLVGGTVITLQVSSPPCCPPPSRFLPASFLPPGFSLSSRCTSTGLVHRALLQLTHSRNQTGKLPSAHTPVSARAHSPHALRRSVRELPCTLHSPTRDPTSFTPLYLCTLPSPASSATPSPLPPDSFSPPAGLSSPLLRLWTLPIKYSSVLSDCPATGSAVTPPASGGWVQRVTSSSRCRGAAFGLLGTMRATRPTRGIMDLCHWPWSRAMSSLV